MLCLDIKTKDIQTNDLIWGALENGYDCEQMWLECGTNDCDEAEASKVRNFIDETKADIAITMNFCPTVSKACYEKGIPYASWIYDSPVSAIYHQEAKRDSNCFFVFDKELLKDFKDLGLHNSFYLPLAANITRTGSIEITKEDEREFYCDVSFVGSGYVDDTFLQYKALLDSTKQAEIDGIVDRMCGKWNGNDVVRGCLGYDLLSELLRAMKSQGSYPANEMPAEVYFEQGLISKVVAGRERNAMMAILSEFRPRWYGAGVKNADRIPGISYFQRLTYEDRLPKAYNLSKINLATTLHSIVSGVPMRVFDIIGCGGFILSNFQPEAEELFDEGKEIILYHDFDELKDLVRFYLEHEEQRTRIIKQGYRRICNEYTYPIAVKKIVHTCCGVR